MFQQTVKNFNINFDVLNERNTFSSGDLIQGHISFDLTKETKITSITMALTGRVHVHWSTGGGGSGKRRRQRRNYSAKMDFFNFKSVIAQGNSAVGRTASFRPGTHVYPFTCQLPQGDFPSAFRGVHGQITYTLTVGIHRPWHMSKDFVTELNFVNRIDTNQPVLRAPLSGSNKMTLCCLWCASGPITMAVSVEKKAFIPGETVKIMCDFSNASSRIATPKVKLQQKQVYYTLNKVHRRMVMKSLGSVTGQPVSAHTSVVHTEIMLTVPPSASLTISNCSLLDLEYFIEVSLTMRASYDLTVLIPIILCNTPVLPFWSSNVQDYSVRSYLMEAHHASLSVPSSLPAIVGQITLELVKDCNVDSLCVKLKGKAEVKWTEHRGKTIVTYHSKEKYFSIKQFIIQKGQGNNNVGQGCHVYPFTFQIPAQDLPSSFEGSCGKIVYTLESNLSRSMRIDSKAEAQFTLIHKADLTSNPLLMTPQHSTADKKMRLFTSGTVSMDVNITRTGFHQGEGIKVVASIQNKSSRDIKPKYCLYKKCSYFAKGKRRVETKDILKEVGDAIPPSAAQTVTQTITIPPTTCVSILNCNNIKTEYRLRVYLDVRYASDPEIKFPIVILPASQVPDGEHPPPYSTYGFEAFVNSDMPGGTSFLQNPSAPGPSAPPLPYGTYGMYPSLTDFPGKS